MNLKRTAPAILVALALVLVCLPLSGCARDPQVQWEKTFDDAAGFSVRQTSDGGYIIAASTNCKSGKGKSAARCDVWVIKTDSSGNLQWDKTFDDPNKGPGLSAEQTPDGGYIIGGSNWLTKTDATGNVEWEKTLDPDSASWASFQQTSDGAYITCGGKASSEPGETNAWLLKVDAAGEDEWEKEFGLGRASSVQQTLDGGYVVLSSNGGAGWCRLIKTDSTGDVELEKSFDRMLETSRVQQTSDGGYVFLAREVLGEPGDEARAMTRNWMIKTDPTGTQERIRLFNHERGWLVQQTPEGGYVILASEEHEVSRLTKTDSTGISDWERRFKNLYASSLDQTSDGGYILVVGEWPENGLPITNGSVMRLTKIEGSR